MFHSSYSTYNVNLFHIRRKKDTSFEINSINCYLYSHECFKPPQTQECVHIILNIKK